MAYFNYTLEWFNKKETMGNCSVKLIEKIDNQNIDKDVIY